jgi:hypothetical protein
MTISSNPCRSLASHSIHFMDSILPHSEVFSPARRYPSTALPLIARCIYSKLWLLILYWYDLSLYYVQFPTHLDYRSIDAMSHGPDGGKPMCFVFGRSLRDQTRRVVIAAPALFEIGFIGMRILQYNTLLLRLYSLVQLLAFDCFSSGREETISFS